MLYFAYGSNMDWNRMRERCAGAQFLFKAVLPDYRLEFTRFSRTNKSGTADLSPAAGQSVWGVVYHLDAQDGEKLDKKEGVSTNAYRRQSVRVQPEGAQARRLDALTYVVCTKESPTPKPSKAYLQHLIDGATHWGLPSDSIAKLQAVETLLLTDKQQAESLVREVATRSIKNNPHLWDDLKTRLNDGQSVDVYGSIQHMDFLAAVQREVVKLSDSDRSLLQNQIMPPPGAAKGITYLDVINGQILMRSQCSPSHVT
jgi:gamma-glutamylcyclotransferase